MPGVFIGAMNITTMAGSVISWPMFWPRKLYCVSAELVPTTLGDHLFARVRRLEEFVGIAAGAGVGRRGQHVMPGWVVQRVVKQRHRGRRVAERRMRRDVLDALAINVDVAAIAQRFQKTRAGEGPLLAADDGLRPGFAMLWHFALPRPTGTRIERSEIRGERWFERRSWVSLALNPGYISEFVSILTIIVSVPTIQRGGQRAGISVPLARLPRPATSVNGITMPEPIGDSRLIEMPGHLIRRLHQISFALF